MGLPSIDGLTLKELFELRKSVEERLAAELRTIATAVQHRLVPDVAGEVAASEPEVRENMVVFRVRHPPIDGCSYVPGYGLPLSLVAQGKEAVLQAIREQPAFFGLKEELSAENGRDLNGEVHPSTPEHPLSDGGA